jgi:hypothetical protein
MRVCMVTSSGRMNIELAIAGLSCFALALGHTVIGARWVIPNLSGRALPRTPFGSAALTFGMVRFTWWVVSIMLFGFGVLLVSLAWAPGADARTLVLRWLALLWLAAAGLAIWSARRRPSTIVRFPVPILMLVIAVMSWIASS